MIRGILARIIFINVFYGDLRIHVYKTALRANDIRKDSVISVQTIPSVGKKSVLIAAAKIARNQVSFYQFEECIG